MRDERLITRNRVTAFLSDTRTLCWLWILLAIISALTKMTPDRCNNFIIFKGVFWHTLNQQSLYAEYPSEYFDINHYGPFFSLVIAPFAVLPHPLGLILWQVMLTLSLWIAVRKLPLGEKSQVLLFWFCAHELLTALFMQQFNISISAIIIGTLVLIKKERDTTAALLIVIGTFVKLYGIVGLAFFFFSRHKLRFVVSLLCWSAVLFILPMTISSPEYIIGQYKEWFFNLVEKNSGNIVTMGGTNISLLGLVRRITGIITYSDILLIVPGILLFLTPYLRIDQYKSQEFQLNILASVLMFTVLFSTGSESSGYIIAFCGCSIWYSASTWKRSKWDIALMVFVFILSSMSPSDLFPRFIREQYVQPYALKALPVTLVWFKLCYEMLTRDYIMGSHYKF